MRRINPGTLVAAAGAVLLLVSLFLDWYDPGLNAWTAFEVWDVVLAALAVAVLAGVAAELDLWRGPVAPVRLAVLAFGALAIVVLALVNHPPAGVGQDTESGIWVALAAVLLLVAGALTSEARISVSLHVDRTGRPGAVAAAPAADPTPPPPGHRDPLFGDGAPTEVASVRDDATQVMPERRPGEDAPPSA